MICVLVKRGRMAYTVPTSEPSVIYAGDTLAFTKTISEFPASERWTLTYYLLSSTNQITFAGTSSGDSYAIAVSASTTSAWTIGDYDWFAEISKGSSSVVERYNVGSGTIKIRKSPVSSSTGADFRSVAKKMVDAFEAYFASSADVDDFSWIRKAVGDLDVSKMSMRDLYQEYQSWKAIYDEEVKANSITTDKRNLNRLYTRFTPL